ERLGERHAIMTVVAACGILTYGGVSLFVVAFAIYPIAKDLFRSADIPKRLIPATIALGSFTFTMTALPGTPAIQNAIPIPYYGTNVFAAPGLGLIARAIMFLGGLWWLRGRAAHAPAVGEGLRHARRRQRRLRGRRRPGRSLVRHAAAIGAAAARIGDRYQCAFHVCRVSRHG